MTSGRSPESLVRDYLEVVAPGDTDALVDLAAPDVRIHGAGVHTSGRDHVVASIRTPGLSDCRITIDELVAVEDRVTAVLALT